MSIVLKRESLPHCRGYYYCILNPENRTAKKNSNVSYKKMKHFVFFSINSQWNEIVIGNCSCQIQTFYKINFKQDNIPNITKYFSLILIIIWF